MRMDETRATKEIGVGDENEVTRRRDIEKISENEELRKHERRDIF